MTDRARTYLVAAVAGLAVASVVVAAGFWLASVIGGGSASDPTFVLDEPGVYTEPTDSADTDVNADVTGELLPDVALVDASGAERRLSEFRGQPLVVNLWFSTCAPCRRELTDFADVHAEVGDRIRFVGIDPFDTVDAMERFAADRGVTYDLWRDPDFTLANELEIVAYPVTLFVSPDGEVLRQTGEIEADSLRAAIEELF